MTNAELRAKCEAVLKEPNYDLDKPFVCPAKGYKTDSTRAHHTAEHILRHIAAGEYGEPKAAKKRKRPIEVD